jgi:hypothetical protein
MFTSVSVVGVIEINLVQNKNHQLKESQAVYYNGLAFNPPLSLLRMALLNY